MSSATISGCEWHTVLQVNDDQFRAPQTASWAAIALCAFLGFSSVITVQGALQLYQRTVAADSSMKVAQPRTPAFTDVPAQFATQIPHQHQQDVYISHSKATLQATTVLGGLFIFVGAAFAFIQRMAVPRCENLALLPMAGLKGSAGDAEEIFTFNNLRAAPGSRHRKKRKGRGHAAGQGATCGFGTRGQKSRKGRSVRPGFEGGQTTLWRRTPKFRGRPLGPGHTRTVYQMVSVASLADAAQGSTVQFDDLSGGKPVLFKVGGVNKGQTVSLPSGLTVKAHAFTGSARAAIEAAGGKCIVIDKYSQELDAEGKVVGAAKKVAMVAFTGEVAYLNESDADSDNDEFHSDDSDVMSDAADGDIAMFAAMAVRSAKVGKYKVPKPLSSKMSPEKQAIIDQVHEALKGSFLVFGFSMQGITMAQISALRKSMPPGVKIQVVKNTLFRMASRGTGFEPLDPLTMGSKAWTFVPEASFQDAVKTYINFAKDAKKQETNPIVGGSLEAQLLTEQEVSALVDLPSRQQSIEKLACLLKSLPLKLVLTLNAMPRKLAVAIRLIYLQKEGAEKAES